MGNSFDVSSVDVRSDTVNLTDRQITSDNVKAISQRLERNTIGTAFRGAGRMACLCLPSLL